jgi:hypothetical protein
MSVMAPNVTTLKNVGGRIAHRRTQHHVRVIAQKVLIVTVLGMIVLLPVASGAARHDRYPVEYELPHLPPELPHLPHELPYVSHTDARKSETNLEDAEASEQRPIRALESKTLKDSFQPKVELEACVEDWKSM